MTTFRNNVFLPPVWFVKQTNEVKEHGRLSSLSAALYATWRATNGRPYGAFAAGIGEEHEGGTPAVGTFPAPTESKRDLSAPVPRTGACRTGKPVPDGGRAGFIHNDLCAPDFGRFVNRPYEGKQPASQGSRGLTCNLNRRGGYCRSHCSFRLERWRASNL